MSSEWSYKPVKTQAAQAQYESLIIKTCAVEPWFNEPRFNEVLGVTNDVLQPAQNYSKLYSTEPRFNEILSGYNEPNTETQT